MKGGNADPAWWGKTISAEWQAGVQGMLGAIFTCGRALVEAKSALPHGEFLKLFEGENRLPFAELTAQRLMQIVHNQRLVNPSLMTHLPPHWATLWKLARLDDATFDLLIERGVIRQDMTSTDLMEALRELKGGSNRALFMRAPTGKYRIIYADPPWSYGAHAQPDYHTEQRDHYAVLPIEEVAAFLIDGKPVAMFVEPSAVLFIWITSPILALFKPVIDQWGFEYKASFIWDKVKHNMGHYNSVRHEILLICTRGSCQPDERKLLDSVVSIERTDHSRKPPEFYDIIETLYTWGRKLELFPRGARKGWDGYGYEGGESDAA
jgi:N6-adenosine-specific RNA methylase IME4